MFMESNYKNKTICPKCHKKSLKIWQELSADEQFLAKNLPMSAGFSIKERERHFFCTNCWYETEAFPNVA